MTSPCSSHAHRPYLHKPGARESWEIEVVVEQLKFDHGYTRSSRAVRFLLEILSELSDAQQRQSPALDLTTEA